MKLVLKIAAALAALLVVAVVALALLAPRIVESEAVRQRIESAARDALGRELRYAELGFGLFPPSLRVREASVAGEKPSAPALVQADEVALRLALWPLLARVVLVDSLVIEGARVHLVRTADGLVLPVPPPRAPGQPAAGPSPVQLAVRGVELRGATVVLEDRAVSPATTWELRDLDARVRGEALDAPFGIAFSGALASGGAFEARGSAGLEAPLDLVVKLDGVALAPARPYLAAALDGGQLAGAVSGQLKVAGPAASPETLSADLALRDARLTIDEMALRGRLSLKADLQSPLGAASGRFDLDATQAELAYGQAFTKPPGKAATVSGRIVTAADGRLGLDDVRLVLAEPSLDVRAKVRTGPRLQVVASAAPFDLRGSEALVPALKPYAPTGEVRIDELTLRTAPLELRGGIELGGVRVRLPERGEVTLRGGLVAEGNAIRSRDLVLVTADQRLRIDAAIRDLATEPRYRVELETEGVETNALVSAFSSQRDTLFGPLAAKGAFSGLAAAGASGVQGQMRFDITPGRLVGVSLLEATFGQLGKGMRGLSQLLASPLATLLTGRDLTRFYGDQFDLLGGTLVLDGNRVRTDDLRLVYREYSASLRGAVDLGTLSLDMEGRLTLGPQIDALLSQKLGLRGEPRALEIPLVAVRGTLSAPQVGLPAGFAQSFLANLALRRLEGELGKQLGKQVPGVVDPAGQAVEVLRGVLEGRTPKLPIPVPPGARGSPPAPAPAEPSAPAPPDPPAPAPSEAPGEPPANPPD